MATSTHLKLPFILPGQAQKHITHNEAIAALDALTQLAVLDRDLGTPPASPDAGARYIVGAAPTGEWTGKKGQIAVWDGAAWVFHQPRSGWLAMVLDENGIVCWDGSEWRLSYGMDGVVPTLGINAAPDGTNRLSVASDSVLFSHASDDVQLVVNKRSSGDRAALLFQTDFSGRAELGTVGDERFHLKLSADGTSWTEAMVIEQGSCHVGIGTSTPAAKLDVDGAVRVKSYPVAGLPSATAIGQIIFVADEAGGATLAFSDGSDWRRVADRAVVS